MMNWNIELQPSLCKAKQHHPPSGWAELELWNSSVSIPCYFQHIRNASHTPPTPHSLLLCWIWTREDLQITQHSIRECNLLHIRFALTAEWSQLHTTQWLTGTESHSHKRLRLALTCKLAPQAKCLVPRHTRMQDESVLHSVSQRSFCSCFSVSRVVFLFFFSGNMTKPWSAGE